MSYYKVIHNNRYSLSIGENIVYYLPDNFEKLIKGYTWSLYRDERAFKYYCQQNNIKKGKNKTWEDAIRNSMNVKYVAFNEYMWDNYDEWGH